MNVKCFQYLNFSNVHSLFMYFWLATCRKVPCMYVHIQTCMYAYKHVHANMYVYMYVCVCVCVLHTYIHKTYSRKCEFGSINVCEFHIRLRISLKRFSEREGNQFFHKLMYVTWCMLPVCLFTSHTCFEVWEANKHAKKPIFP